ncbi:MAG: hypothetical protein AAB530_02110 [Patescibacteria group bacterium]
MPLFNYPIKNKKIILALGSESAGNFSIYFKKKFFFSEDFGDLLDEKNYKNYKKSILAFFKKNKLKPNIILTDLHPLYKTTIWGKILAKKYKAKHIQVQHHIAHIFSAIGETQLNPPAPPYQEGINQGDIAQEGIAQNYIGIACDGTGFGLDEKIWGGEVFQIFNFQTNSKFKIQNNKKYEIKRIGHLENQIMIGGDLAIKEPARMLIAILAKITNYELRITNKSQTLNLKSKIDLKSKILNLKLQKNFIYQFVKKFYTKNQFELLYNQLQQNFNCRETSSAGRILDAVSILLGLCQNERKYKHEPIKLLEKNSTIPYRIKSKIKNQKSKVILETTPLFEYLIKNLHRNKKRLAATAQRYIIQGLYEIIFKSKIINHKSKIFIAGGLANNKIFSAYAESRNIYLNKKIPRGDAGLSFGQIVWYLKN